MFAYSCPDKNLTRLPAAAVVKNFKSALKDLRVRHTPDKKIVSNCLLDLNVTHISPGPIIVDIEVKVVDVLSLKYVDRR